MAAHSKRFSSGLLSCTSRILLHLSIVLLVLPDILLAFCTILLMIRNDRSTSSGSHLAVALILLFFGAKLVLFATSLLMLFFPGLIAKQLAAGPIKAAYKVALVSEASHFLFQLLGAGKRMQWTFALEAALVFFFARSSFHPGNAISL